MRHPKDIGNRTTLAVMYALQLQRWPFAVPFGENTRYDLIVDVGSMLRRVQCKTGRLRSGGVVFNTCSSYGHHHNPKQVKRDYQGEIDDFAVFCPELGSVYLIPIDDVTARRVATLRVDRPRNNQYARVRLAAQYEIARFEVL
jgi:hypothetical protein